MRDDRGALATAAVVLLVLAVCITAVVLVDLDLPRREHIGAVVAGGGVAVVAWLAADHRTSVQRRGQRP